MATSAAGLVRVTIAAPRRRIDIALPENLPVAEMLPVLLRHGGEELADDGVDHGGWVLRRPDGAILAPARTFGAHRVHEGEVLHLAPGQQEWPELDYDDLADAIASGARRTRPWSSEHTRRAGVAIGAVGVALGLVAVFRTDADAMVAGRWALGFSALLLLVAAVLSRALGESAAAAVAGLLALPYAFVGAALAIADPGGWPQLPAGRAEAACAVTAVAALIALVAVGVHLAPFVAVISAAVAGVVGSWLCNAHGYRPDEAAAVIIAAAVLATPLLNGLAIAMARMPTPALPRSSTDLIRDQRQPPRAAVYSAVTRADTLLSGMLSGLCASAAVSAAVLAGSGSTAAAWLLVIVSACYWVRARTYVSVRHRAPMLMAALAATLALLLGPLMNDPDRRLSQAGPLLLAFGAVACAAGLGYARRKPGPYLRRYVEIVEVLLILAVLPVCAAVLGLYARMRGLV